LTGSTERGGRNPVPSLHSSQRGATFSGAVFLAPGPAGRF